MVPFENVAEEERVLSASDGVALQVRLCCPTVKTRAVLCLVHGHGDHAARFADGIDVLLRAGLAVVAFDLRGHGLSGGARGDCPSYDALLDDIGRVVTLSEQRFPDKALFLFGHSLGGNLALNYALRRASGLSGIVVVNPWLDLAFRVAPWKLAVVRLMNAVRPGFPMSTGRRSWTSCQAEVDVDSLVHRTMTPRLFCGAGEAARWASAHAADLTLPLLAIHGVDDRSTSCEATRRFCLRVAGGSRYVAREGLGHDIHGAEEERPLFAAVAAWIVEHLDQE